VRKANEKKLYLHQFLLPRQKAFVTSDPCSVAANITNLCKLIIRLGGPTYVIFGDFDYFRQKMGLKIVMNQFFEQNLHYMIHIYMYVLACKRAAPYLEGDMLHMYLSGHTSPGANTTISVVTTTYNTSVVPSVKSMAFFNSKRKYFCLRNVLDYLCIHGAVHKR
jgi:hypothetical protein